MSFSYTADVTKKLSSIEKFLFLGLSAVTLMGFFWPFFVSTRSQAHLAPWILLAAAPLTLISLAVTISRNKLDTKTIALLATLAALIAAMRPLGAGAIGIEPMWFILILAARIFGPYFGFILGALSMFLSALLTGGFGPWFNYQLFAAAWMGASVILIPRSLRGTREIGSLALLALLDCELFGIAMDLQFWPWSLGQSTQLSYKAGAPLQENLDHFFTYHFTASMAWDIPRALFTAALIVITGPSVLNALRRAYVKAAFVAPVRFEK